MSDNQRIEDLRRRVLKDPSSIAFAQLAEECRRAGQYAESVEVCRAGLAIHPGYLSARVTLGRALIELNQLAVAQEELDFVLKSAPENLAAIRGLAEIHQRSGSLAEALKHYRAALLLARNDPDLQRTVAELERAVEPAKPPASADGLTFEQMENEFLLYLPPPPKPPPPIPPLEEAAAPVSDWMAPPPPVLDWQASPDAMAVVPELKARAIDSREPAADALAAVPEPATSALESLEPKSTVVAAPEPMAPAWDSLEWGGAAAARPEPIAPAVGSPDPDPPMMATPEPAAPAMDSPEPGPDAIDLSAPMPPAIDSPEEVKAPDWFAPAPPPTNAPEPVAAAPDGSTPAASAEENIERDLATRKIGALEQWLDAINVTRPDSGT